MTIKEVYFSYIFSEPPKEICTFSGEEPIREKTIVDKLQVQKLYSKELIAEDRNIVKVILPKKQIAHEESCLLAKMILDNPSLKTKQLVKTIFKNLGNLVNKYNLNANDFDFLLECVPDARSPYSWKHARDPVNRLKQLEQLVNQLKNFDEVDDFDLNFSQYAADLDTLMTAFGYRAIGPSWITNTVEPSENMKAILRDFRSGEYIIPAIGEREFPHRFEEDASHGSHKAILEIPQGIQDEVIGGLPGPQPGLRARVFTFDSYVARGLLQGISMRAHSSGSAPLTLAALQFTLNNGEKRIIPDEPTLIELSGLLCAVYVIGDFHSFAETAAGIAHFYQTYVDSVHFSNQEASILEKVSPKTFLSLSIGFLSSIVSDEEMERFTTMSQRVMDLCRSEESHPEPALVAQRLLMS